MSKLLILCTIIIFFQNAISGKEIKQINSFGFTNQSSENLFKAEKNDVSFFRKPVTFEYDESWNASFLNGNNNHSLCASAVGNLMVVESQGAGNTTMILNQQNNNSSTISAQCILGN